MKHWLALTLGILSCLSVLQIAEECTTAAPEVAARDAGAYLQTALPADLDPLQAAALLDGLRVVPGARLVLPTTPYRKREVEFLAPLIREALGTVGFRVQLGESDLIVEVPPDPNLGGHQFFINTWSGTLEIGLARILE